MFSTIQLVLMPLSFALLLVLMLLYWGQTAFFSYKKYDKVIPAVFNLAFLSLTSMLLLRWVESGHFPLSNLYESLLFLSWSFLLSQYVLQWKGYQSTSAHQNNHIVLENAEKPTFTDVNSLQKDVKNEESLITLQPYNEFIESVGVIISPLALLSYAFAFLNLPKEMQKATSLVPALQSNWLMMHVTVMILSYAALLCGSVLSMAFLLLDFINKDSSKVSLEQSFLSHKGEGDRLNSSRQVAYTSSWDFSRDTKSICSYLDNKSYRMLGFGFPLLTVGILSGAVWANSAWGSYWSWDPKETWALITWLVFAIYLHARITKGWSGQKPALIATLGFFVVWFCYLGVNLLGTGLHSYGWFNSTQIM